MGPVRTRRAIRATLVSLAWLAVAPLAEAVVVAPHAVFLAPTAPSAVVWLYNPSDRAEEVSIAFRYGYPVSDSSGQVSIRYIDEPGPGEPSAAGWIRAYPRRLRLEPRRRQAVRLLARPPAELPDGEYWSRMVVHSRPTGRPTIDPTGDVRIGLALAVRTAISVSYRSGSPRTEVRLEKLDTGVLRDSLIVRADMVRGGDAAWLGTLTVSVADAAGTVVREWSRPIAVYRSMLRRVALPIDGLPAGDYFVTVELIARRSDIPPEDLLPADPVRRRVSVSLP